MAKCYISEFDRLGEALGSGQAQIAKEPPVASQAFTFSITTQSTAFNARTRYIEIHADVIWSYSVGDDPTATTSNMRMAADERKYIAVGKGQKLAAVTNT